MVTTRPPDDPPPAAPEAPAAAVATTPSPAELLDGESPIYWLVPDRSGAPRCAAFLARPYSVQGTGMLQPLHPQSGIAQGTAHLPDGRVIGPEPPDPYRRVSFAFQRQQDSLTLHTPRGKLSSQWAVLSGCSSTHKLSVLPWFASQQACESERDQVPPMDFGDCGAVVPGFPFADQGPDWLGRKVKGGGQAYEITVEGSERRCTAWHFIPRGRPGQGTMKSRKIDGARTTVTTYSYEYHGDQLVLLGPSHQSFEHGREVSNLGFGCGETHYVRHLDAHHATVGGAHWYPTRQHCQQATSVRRDEHRQQQCSQAPPTPSKP